jgi:hypothetical protein
MDLDLVARRGAELRAAAAAYRLRRECRRRPALPVRIYARLWWASRPRAAVWAPALLDRPAPLRGIH